MPVVARIVSARSRALKLALLGLATVMLASCGGESTGPSVTEPNFVRLQSDAGDYVGGGKSLEFTQHNSTFKVTLTDNVVRIEVQGDEKWFGSFAAPVGSSLARGTYVGTRFPLNPGNKPGLVWLSDSRVCTELTGSFTIDRISVIDGVITNLDLHFEQRCEGSTAALRGTIHWRDDDSTTLDGPVSPVPTNLWTPNPADVPASGNYVMLASDPGDPIGQGQLTVYTPPTTIIVSSNGTTIKVNVGGYSGTFQGMIGPSLLPAGYYGNVRRFLNPVRGQLEWIGNGRGCNTLTGWFAIDRISYTGTTMTALEMRFEQHCEDGTPALHGAIRWAQ